MMLKNNRPTQSGYTLLEVLIVIALFAIVSGLVFSGFRQVISQQQNLENRLKLYQKEQQVWQLIEQDFRQIVPRWFDRDGNMLTPLYAQTSVGMTAIELSRLADPYDTQPFQPLRIRYVYERGQLWRYASPIGEMDNQKRHLLLPDVTSVSIRFKNTNGNWYQIWPVDDTTFQLPVAFEVVFEFNDGRLLKKRFHGYPQRKIITKDEQAQP